MLCRSTDTPRFRYGRDPAPDQPRHQPYLLQPALLQVCLRSLPRLPLPGCQPGHHGVGASRVSATVRVQRRRLSVSPRIRLPGLRRFRGPRFQSTSLPAETHPPSGYLGAPRQRLCTLGNAVFPSPQLHGLSYSAAPGRTVGAECSTFFRRTPGGLHPSRQSACTVGDMPRQFVALSSIRVPRT